MLTCYITTAIGVAATQSDHTNFSFFTNQREYRLAQVTVTAHKMRHERMYDWAVTVTWYHAFRAGMMREAGSAYVGTTRTNWAAL